jgi:tetratricopeptide (TPR) repeat protein
MTGGVDRIERIPAGGSDWHLQDERELLRRSLEDAAREHGAGDLTDEDYEVLRSRDERRLAELDAAIDAARAARGPVAAAASESEALTSSRSGSVLTPRPIRRSPRPRVRVRWRRHWWMAAMGLAAVVSACVLLLVDLTSPRLPGQDATGGITLNTAQTIDRQLAQAKSLISHHEATQALQIYGQVLAEDPRQPVALAEWGWLDWRAATRAKEQTVAAEGASALEESVKVDPQLFAAQYYLGVVLYDEGAAGKAVARFARFLADKPTRAWLREAAPTLRAAYGAAHQPVPAGVPGA